MLGKSKADIFMRIALEVERMLPGRTSGEVLGVTIFLIDYAKAELRSSCSETRMAIEMARRGRPYEGETDA